jgi:cell division protein FtsB
MAQKPEKTKSRKSLLLRLILAFLAIYAVVALVDMQITLVQKKQELVELESKAEAQRLANKDLERELTADPDEDYIERYAREYLDYVAPDERVFIDISGS